ncbi:hypothetical protein SZL87_07675 [Exiguobacterium indicum]|uniref:HTH cro/C1-type domain-containing protein n=1 Tax=Exiguobacterium indicum TaxID=296995 RepID=A0ABU8EH91_9BACL
MYYLTFLRILMMLESLSNKELALKLGVSEANLKEWADGERNIPYQWFNKFKEVLDIDNPQLLSNKMELPSVEEMGLIGDATIVNVQQLKNNRQIIWQPVGTDMRNFHRSILDEQGMPPIHFDDRFLTDLNQHLIDLDVKKVSVWGVKDGKNYVTFNKFQRIENGDIVMFYSTQKFVAYGEVIGKIESKEWSKELWWSEDFENIYVLRDVKTTNLDFLEVTKIVYGESGKSLQSLRILDDEKSESMYDFLNLQDN